MSDLTQKQKDACRKASAYYAALEEGKKVAWMSDNGSWNDEGHEFPLYVSGALFFIGFDFDVIEPPKMRPYRDDELQELLGVKIRRGRKSGEVFLPTDTREMNGREMFDFCTFFDGPNAGKPVGKVDA
jgi:hypothetical protein